MSKEQKIMQHSNKFSNESTNLVSLMFDQPSKFRSEVERTISRNRKLSSQRRRELMWFAYGTFKWRDRLWNQKPVNVDFEAIQVKIQEFQSETFPNVLQKIKSLSLEEQAKYLSYPVWLFQSWIEEYGQDKAVEIAWIQNQQADLCIRANGLEKNFDKLAAKLNAEGVEIQKGAVPGAFYIPKKTNIRGLNTFKNGLFEIQDEHSQQVCRWVESRPFDFIIDGCSRTGGKALHLAAIQNNQGRILCMDIDARVFEELEKRSKRLGITNIQTRWIAKDDPAPSPDLVGKADIVFVDAPCTGTGTIRHNPAVKWTLTADQIATYTHRQKEILDRQCRWVKPRGTLVYVTCSLLKQENEDVIQSFLQKHPEFKLARQEKLLPKSPGGDGFFFAKLEK